MAEEETTPPPPPPPPAPVLVHAWLPADPLPVLGEDEEAPARKPLDVILRDIPRRLKASAPVATQRRCRQALADARAKLEALGEIAEDDEEAEAKNSSKAELEGAIAEEEAALAEADAAYEALAASLCKGEHTTRAWVDSLNRYVDAGAREIIPDADRAHRVAVPGTTEPDAPGGGPNARRVVGDADDAAFASAADAAVTNAALLSRVACKATGEFLTQAGVEKRAPPSRTRAETKPFAVPRYEPNPYVGAEAAVANCEPWADAQIAALGDAVERLERVIIRWRDTDTPGVARVLVAMTTMGEDPDSTPETRKVGGAYVEVDDAGVGATRALRECAALGVFPAGLIVPAAGAFSAAAARTRAACDDAGVEVIAKDVLMGGLVSEKYLGFSAASLAAPSLAEARGSPSFEPLRFILASPGGWDAHARALEALNEAGVGSVETAAVACFLEMNMRVVVTTSLRGAPAYDAAALEAFLPPRLRAPEPAPEPAPGDADAGDAAGEAPAEAGADAGDALEAEETLEPGKEEAETTPEPGKKLDAARRAWDEAYGPGSAGTVAA